MILNIYSLYRQEEESRRLLASLAFSVQYVLLYCTVPFDTGDPLERAPSIQHGLKLHSRVFSSNSLNPVGLFLTLVGSNE